MSNQVPSENIQTGSTNEDEEPADSHLEDIDDGCGCTEVWEHMSEHRSNE